MNLGVLMHWFPPESDTQNEVSLSLSDTQTHTIKYIHLQGLSSTTLYSSSCAVFTPLLFTLHLLAAYILRGYCLMHLEVFCANIEMFVWNCECRFRLQSLKAMGKAFYRCRRLCLYEIQVITLLNFLNIVVFFLFLLAFFLVDFWGKTFYLESGL
jgi:hypothetical protein